MVMATARQLLGAGLHLDRLRPSVEGTDAAHALYVLEDSELALPASQSSADPRQLECITVDDMAKQMGCSTQAVYQREHAGELFSVLAPGRTRGRKYPRFQIEPQTDRSTLVELIRLFRDAQDAGVNANDLWNFLQAARDEFGGRSILDVLTRKTTGKVPSAQERRAILDLAEEEISQISS